MRYAGDNFGISLAPTGTSASSVLVDYFPELKQIGSKPKDGTEEERETGARGFGGTQAPATFTGFKTLQNPSEAKAAPEFFGFKTFEF